MEQFRGTTIVAVRRHGKVVIGGDGQVSMGQTVMKSNARKVRRLRGGSVIAGFAGGTADAFTLFELFEAQLDRHQGQLVRAAVELAKAWVQAMEAFAKQRGRRTSVRLAIIPGIRHNSAKLTPYAIRVFFPLFSKKKASHATP